MADRLGTRPWTWNNSNCGLVAGTTSTYSTTSTTNASINGKFVTTQLTTQTNTASPTTDATTGAAFPAITANKAACIVYGLNLAGSIQLCQGRIIDTYPGLTTTVGAFKEAPPFPDLPDDFVPLGYGLIRVTPTQATFTLGTTAWTSGTCTTIQNVSQLPARPQIA